MPSTSERITAYLSAEEYRSGDRLPSERELACDLGLTRHALRSALKELEDSGIVESVSPRIRLLRRASQRCWDPTSGTVAFMTVCPLRGLNAWQPIERQLDGAVSTVANADWNTLLLLPAEDTAGTMAKLRSERPRALVVLPDGLPSVDFVDMLSDCHREGATVIAMGDTLPHGALTNVPFDTVTGDHRGGTRALVEWLHGRGHRRMLRCWHVLGDERTADIEWYHERNAGYDEGCRESGVECLPPLLLPARPPDVSEDSFNQHVRVTAGFLLEVFNGPNPPDALIALADELAYMLSAACRLVGREPQRDIAVVGYDLKAHVTWERNWESSRPPVSVNKHDGEAGRMMGRLAIDRIAGTLGDEPQRIVSPHAVVELDADGAPPPEITRPDDFK